MIINSADMKRNNSRGFVMNTTHFKKWRYLVVLILALMEGQVYANGAGDIRWNGAPDSGTPIGSGEVITDNFEVYVRGAGARAEITLSGSCYLGTDVNSQSASQNGNPTTLSRKVTMRPGNMTPLQRCTVNGYQTRGNGSGRDSRSYILKQTVSINNPGTVNDLQDPGNPVSGGMLYKITVSARNTDGLGSTLSETNKLSYTVETPDVCTITETDINSVWIQNAEDSGGKTCTLRATASGNSDIQGGVSAVASWAINNTRVPQLTLVTAPTTGKKPTFTYNSSLASINNGARIVATPDGGNTDGQCAGAVKTAVAGLNSMQFNALTIGSTYSCRLVVENANGPGHLDLPVFKVVPSHDGPGGVGGVDGDSGVSLWLKGGNWQTKDNNIQTWFDASGSGHDFTADIQQGEDGSLQRPFTSLSAARYAMRYNMISAGYFHFNLNGQSFKTYVDQQGYVLVISSKRLSPPPASGYPQTRDLTLRSARMLDQAIFAQLDVTRVRISMLNSNDSDVGLDGYNDAPLTLQKIRDFETLPNQDEGGNWTLTKANTSERSGFVS